MLKKEDTSRVAVFDNNENGIAHLRTRLADDPRLRWFIGDIRDKDRVFKAIEKIDVCIHCAALKHVDLGENNPFEQVKTNVIGTQICIDAALFANIDKFLFISSDKAVQAINTYGRCKALSESLTLDAENYKGDRRTKFAVARPPNYIDSDGSIFDLWKYQKEAGLPITLTDDRMVRYFMSFDDINKFLFRCLDMMQGGEIFVPLNVEKRRIIDLAKGMETDIKLIGMRPGQKLEEVLIDPAELSRAIQFGDMWIVKS